jgi:hypothetical protein
VPLSRHGKRDSDALHMIMKWITLAIVFSLCGCISSHPPTFIYVDRQAKPPVAIVILDDGKVLYGSIRYVANVKLLVERMEPRLTSVGWDSIKEVRILSSTNSLPDDWHVLPGVTVLKDAEQ